MVELEGWEKNKMCEALDIVIDYLSELGEDEEGNCWADFKEHLEAQGKI